MFDSTSTVIIQNPANLFSEEIIKIVLSGLITLFVAWFIWNIQKRYNQRKEMISEKKRYIKILKLVANDLEVGLRNAICIALSAFFKRDTYLLQRVQNRSRITEIVGFTFIKVNDLLVDDIMLVYDHFELVNSYIKSFLESQNTISASIGGVGYSDACKIRSNIAFNIVCQSRWDLKHIISIHNKVIDELSKYGEGKRNYLEVSFINEIFKKEMTETSNFKFASDKQFERFKEEIDFPFEKITQVDK